MKVIGITGNSGSGKTTLSEIFRKQGIKVIDCDKVAKGLNNPNTEYMKKIVETFGNIVLQSDGNLNRKKLSEIIYNNKEALNKLNQLTFKYVVDEIKIQLKNLENDGEKIVGIDAPLLYEANLDKSCNYIIGVIASDEIKIKRICNRDKISEEVAKQRLKIQKSDDYFKEKVDLIIENNKEDTEKLKNSVKEIIKKLT